MRLKLSKLAVGIFCCSSLVGCATKDFGKLPNLNDNNIAHMNCDEIRSEISTLYSYEDSVDREASTGQAKQILWGGLWSVMADEKLEDQARRDIRKRERMLNEARIKKGCK